MRAFFTFTLLSFNVLSVWAQRASPIRFDFWYGPEQSFGQPGLTQRYVNVLGNVRAPAGVASLTYALNGGVARPLTLGKDGFRLAETGDFNAELDGRELRNGPNRVVFTATDSARHRSSEQVVLQVKTNQRWLPGYALKWEKITDPQTAVQVVDGQWRQHGIGLRTADPGYARAFAVGGSDWTDYELITTVVVHRLETAPDPADESRLSIAPHWSGHTADSLQPHRQCFGQQTVAEFTFSPDLRDCRWRFVKANGAPLHFSPHQRRLVAGKAYKVKLRVESLGDGTAQFSAKLWEDGKPEPMGWEHQTVDSLAGAPAGGALLVAHHADLTFGNLYVAPLRTFVARSK